MEVSLTNILTEFHTEHGRNIVDFFCDQFDMYNLMDYDFTKLKQFFKYEHDFLFWKEHGKISSSGEYSYQLFSGSAISAYNALSPHDSPSLKFKSIPNILEAALTNELKGIVQDCIYAIRKI